MQQWGAMPGGAGFVSSLPSISAILASVASPGGASHGTAVKPEPKNLVICKHRRLLFLGPSRSRATQDLLIGLNEVAIEMSLPSDIDADSELLLPSERARLRSARRDRLARATERARASTLEGFEHNGSKYEGRVGLFDLPPVGPEFPYRKVRVRQGVTPELIREVSVNVRKLRKSQSSL